jgi:endonuclease-3
VTAKRSSGKALTNLRARVDEILARLRVSNPDPRCELYYETPFQLLVSVVLSAQATDKSVNDAMRSLYEQGLTPKDILALGEQGFLAKIRRIGLAPTKSKNVLKLSKIIQEQYADKIPNTREELEALPGVGRKTANVILGEIFREPTIAVDTHVFRVTARLGLHKEPTPEKAEIKLLSIIDKKWLPMAHHWFILHGRYTCLARTPKCDACVLTDICKYAKKSLD